MSTVVPLEAIPNQSLTIRLDGVRYALEIKEAGGVMAVTIARDGVPLVTGARCVAGAPLLPYRHLWAGFGNFIFTDSREDGSIPYFEDFGSAVFLVYSSAAEIAEVVGNV